ncbi:MAG: transcriptional repressor [Elusimicrobia bacterium]|nr:transcriptional repressor [Elusimicrobiota bacterium]
MDNHKELIFFPTWTAGRKGYAERMRQVFQDYLRQKDLLLTPQRMAILNHLLEADKHLSQEEIYHALKPRGIGKVTVFRTLKTLEQCHLVEEVLDPAGKPRYEIKMERPQHDHLICVECGGITEIQWPEIEKAQEKACKKLGFSIIFHRHEVFGRCSDCQRKQR